MTIGDKSAQSYGWRHVLGETVRDGDSVVVPAPGLDLRYTDTEYADVTLLSDGAVWRTGKGKVEVVFDMNEDHPSATVTNTTGKPWPVRDEIYVFCPHMLGEGGNEWDLKGQIYDLQQRVSALEAPPEAGRSPSEPSKAPPTPVKAAIPPNKPPNSPSRGVQPPTRGR